MNINGADVEFIPQIEDMDPIEQMLRTTEARVNAIGWDQNVSIFTISRVQGMGFAIADLPFDNTICDSAEQALEMMDRMFRESLGDGCGHEDCGSTPDIQEKSEAIVAVYKEKGWLPKNVMGLIVSFEGWILKSDTPGIEGAREADPDNYIRNHENSTESRMTFGIFAWGDAAAIIRKRDVMEPEYTFFKDEAEQRAPHLGSFRGGQLMVNLFMAIMKVSDRDEIVL